MQSERVPVVHRFGIVSQKIAQSIIDKENKEMISRNSSPNRIFSPRSRISQNTLLPERISSSPLSRKSIPGNENPILSSDFIRNYNKEIYNPKTPIFIKIHRKLEECFKLTEKRSLSFDNNSQFRDIGATWKDFLLMFQCQGSLQDKILEVLLVSLRNAPLSQPSNLFSLLHMASIELKDALEASDEDISHNIANASTSKLHRCFNLSEVLLVGYHRLYLQFLLGNLGHLKNIILVLKVLQTSLDKDLFALYKDIPYVIGNLNYCSQVLRKLNTTCENWNVSQNFDENKRTLSGLLAFDTPQLSYYDQKIASDLSPELFHTLDIFHEYYYGDVISLNKAVCAFINCLSSTACNPSIAEFHLIITIFGHMALTDIHFAEFLATLPILYSLCPKIAVVQNMQSLIRYILEDFEVTIIEFTFPWLIDFNSIYIQTLTNICMHTKISSIRKLFLLGKFSHEKPFANFDSRVGLIDLASYQNSSNLETSLNVRYVALKGIKDIFAFFTAQVSSEKQYLPPLGIREIALQTCHKSLENETNREIIQLLNCYRPSIYMFTKNSDFYQTIAKLLCEEYLEYHEANLTKILTSTLRISSPKTPRKVNTFPITRLPSNSVKKKIHINMIRNKLPIENSQLKNELKVRNISYIDWLKSIEKKISHD